MDLPTKFTSNPPQVSTTGKILLGLTGGVAVSLTVICVPFISPALRKFCLPYIPATQTQIENIRTALKGRKGKLVDLGSGDGRIVLEMARDNFEAHGVELNFWLVLYSRLDALRRGLRNKSEFFRRDLWKFPVKEYDNVVIFGVEQMMADLERKLELECKEDCCVVACRFPLPGKTPVHTVGHGIDTVWVYRLNNDKRPP